VGVVVSTAPQDWLRLRLLFVNATFLNVWRGVAETISCTPQHSTYVENSAVWCGAMLSVLFLHKKSTSSMHSAM